MAFIKGLKTSDLIQARGIGETFPCLFCHCSPESHNHLFFECQFTWNILKKFLLLGNYLLLAPTLSQVLHHATSFNHKISKRIYLLIVSAMIYCLWKERNQQAFQHNSASLINILHIIRSFVNHKMKRWKFKCHWPSEVTNLWLAWSQAATDPP